MTTHHQLLHASPSPPSRDCYEHSPDLQRPLPDPRYYHPAYRHHKHPARPQTALLRPAGNFPSPYQPVLSPASSRRASQACAPQQIPPLDPPWIPSSTTFPEGQVPLGPDRRRCGSADDRQQSISADKAPSRNSTHAPSSQSPSSHHVISTYDSDDGNDEGRRGPTTRQTVKSLLHLAVAVVPLSFAITIYVIFALLFALISAPIRFCFKSQPTLKERIFELLLPPLNLQLKCIYIPPVTLPESRRPSSSQTPLSSDEILQRSRTYGSCSPAGLITTHLLGPFVALLITVCAWVMGVAWALGAIVSDESAGDVRDERGFAERVVGWWARWLNRGNVVASIGDDDRRPGRRRTREMSQWRGRGEVFV